MTKTVGSEKPTKGVRIVHERVICIIKYVKLTSSFFEMSVSINDLAGASTAHPIEFTIDERNWKLNVISHESICRS